MRVFVKEHGVRVDLGGAVAYPAGLARSDDKRAADHSDIITPYARLRRAIEPVDLKEAGDDEHLDPVAIAHFGIVHLADDTRCSVELL